MTIETETLLPEPSSSSDVATEMVAAVDLKATEDMMLNATAEALPTSSADLFGGELGVDELNEIPSLFDLDSQQMSADLETLGFSSSSTDKDSSDNNEIPFLVNSSDNSAAVDGSDSQVSASKSDEMSSKKRAAAEISEDEECQSSTSSEPKRVARTVTDSSTATTTASPPAPAKKPLAPKPASKKASAAKNEECSRGVDTSTAHVKALTGAKGAAMCFEIVSGTERDTTVAIPNLAAADLTPEEKAKFSRDRNRLHARNTRIRKKAYVDELKRTLDVLVQERDASSAEKERKIQIEKEEKDVRFSVLEEFLRLRGCNERSPVRWNAILEDNITLCLPNLDFHEGSAGGGVVSKKVLSGVPELMKECNDFAEQVQAGRKGGRGATGNLSFQCDRLSLLMEGSNVVLDWTATSSDPNRPVTMRGTCRASFNPQSNKLHTVEMFFDSSPLFA